LTRLDKITFFGTLCDNQYCERPLGLKKGTPNCVLYGELCRFAIDIEIKSRMVAFWKKIICNKQDKIAVMAI
jgi:hypothetical protein